MTSGMLQDTMQTSSPAMGPRFQPYASPKHQVTKGRYITSNDPRGYIPVYEYPLNGQWIMMDIDDGYILWTGIWKALGNSKADIVKMIDSQPDLAPLIRRVRGGYLKIQGTWMPYEVALRLSRRVAWTIRDDLVPLFGPTFPSTCLSPDQPGYGQVVASGPNRRRIRRNTQSTPALPSIPREPHANWTVVTPSSAVNTHQSVSQQPLIAPISPALTALHSPLNSHHVHQHAAEYPQFQHHRNSNQYPTSTSPSNVYPRASSPISPRSPSERSSALPPTSGPGLGIEHHHLHLAQQRGASGGSSTSIRYSPYSSHASIGNRRASTSGPTISSSTRAINALEIPSMSSRDYPTSSRASIGSMQPPTRPPSSLLEHPITLPPVRAPAQGTSQLPYALPPISALEDLRGAYPNDSAAVLRRLKGDDEPEPSTRQNRGSLYGGYNSDNSDDGHEDPSESGRRSSSVQPNFK
ncbi:hypothetical protein BDN72DRAFT_333537 [Pluteus cervinus]|uniref:Uncharacterized protein n=1 Tax=Pluteus cervinus TaxID=181527 RepID=A0ACD3ACV6_9AGAR|nr:hypothetical protein BDN72DRAFT_333537 [Pluteus cervinus]